LPDQAAVLGPIVLQAKDDLLEREWFWHLGPFKDILQRYSQICSMNSSKSCDFAAHLWF
jgi:hypothetical protein